MKRGALPERILPIGNEGIPLFLIAEKSGERDVAVRIFMTAFVEIDGKHDDISSRMIMPLDRHSISVRVNR
jgi:hypothetical protein